MLLCGCDDCALNRPFRRSPARAVANAKPGSAAAAVGPGGHMIVAAGVRLGLYPIVALEKQVLNMIGNPV